MTSVVVLEFFRIISSCCLWEVALYWVYDTGKTSHDFNPSRAVPANRSDCSTDDQCLDSWKCCFYLGKWLKICFKDQWSYFFFFPLLSIGERFVEWKNEGKPAEIRSVFFVLCPPLVKNQEKSLVPKTLSLSRVWKDWFFWNGFFFPGNKNSWNETLN